MKIALVTGASSGIGSLYTEKIAARYPDLDEIWVVARRKDRLIALSEKVPQVHIRPIEMDLSRDDSYSNLRNLLEQSQADVRILINNAGFARSGDFSSMPEKDILSTLSINVKGMTMVHKEVFPYMKRGAFEIMTCSVSAFTPLPGLAVYSASKSYIYHLGIALHEEMKGSGVNLMLLCPGNMNTEMNPKVDSLVPGLPYLNMDKTVDSALTRAARGETVYTPGIFYKLMRFAGKLVPFTLAAAGIAALASLRKK